MPSQTFIIHSAEINPADKLLTIWGLAVNRGNVEAQLEKLE